jgi:hypothetical protein
MLKSWKFNVDIFKASIKGQGWFISLEGGVGSALQQLKTIFQHHETAVSLGCQKSTQVEEKVRF